MLVLSPVEILGIEFPISLPGSWQTRDPLPCRDKKPCRFDKYTDAPGASQRNDNKNRPIPSVLTRLLHPS